MTDAEQNPAPGLARRLSAPLAGLVAAGVALGVAELTAAAVSPYSSPVLSVGSAVINATPAPVKEFAVAQFGTNDKPLLVGSVVVVLALLSMVVGALAVRRRWVGLVGVAALGVAGAIAAVLQSTSSISWAIPSLVGGVVGAGALELMVRPLRDASPSDAAADGEQLTSDTVRASSFSGPSRRFFLGALGGSAVLAAVSGAVGRLFLRDQLDVEKSRAAVRLPEPVQPGMATPAAADLGITDLEPFITPNADFYRVDRNLVVPAVPAETYRLRIHGMVDREIDLSYYDLLDLGLEEHDITMTCVSNQVGDKYISTSKFSGVSLPKLLERAGLDPEANQIFAQSVDGFTTGTPIASVMDGRPALLAVAMNGEPLPAEHGFPVRMVVPGIYGYASACKWLVDIEVTTFAKKQAYWTTRGYAEKAPIKGSSKIETPRPFEKVAVGQTIPVAGVAWSQTVGVDKVEVKVDDGDWQEATLAAADNIYTWRQFVWMWTPEKAGSIRLSVRATFSDGDLQIMERMPPLPDGSTGWQTVAVSAA